MDNIFFKTVLRADVGETTAQHDLFHGQLAHLFVEVCEEAVLACNATFKGADISGETSRRRRPHIHRLPCTEESDQVAIRAPKTEARWKNLPHPYLLNTRDELPEALGSL